MMTEPDIAVESVLTDDEQKMATDLIGMAWNSGIVKSPQAASVLKGLATKLQVSEAVEAAFKKE